MLVSQTVLQPFHAINIAISFKQLNDTFLKSVIFFLLVPCYNLHISKRIHSKYRREIQDLPIQNKKVVLLVLTRKVFCDNLECSHKTFSEIHPFVSRKGRITKRLEESILSYSTHLSSIKASKLLSMSGIKIGKSSICDMLKKNPVNCG